MKASRLADEEKCESCNGTGYPPVKEPKPGTRIYWPPCKECGGKGRINRKTSKDSDG
jgi:DnaJ-class molecular chaperone